jgi:hypothetical protein
LCFGGREISLIHISHLLRTFLFIIIFHSSIQYLSSHILHLIYTLPTCTLHACTQCVLLHPNIFLPFSCASATM